MLGAVLVEEEVDGSEDGWRNKLGSCDGREVGAELGTGPGAALIDGSSKVCKDGRVNTIGDPEGTELGAELIIGSIEG